MAFRQFATGDLDETCFIGTVQFPGNRRFGAEFPVQRRVKPLGDKRFADVKHGQGVTPDNLGNLGVGFVGMEQDVGMADRGGGGFTAVNEVFEERSLVIGKGNDVPEWPSSLRMAASAEMILGRTCTSGISNASRVDS